MRMHVFAASVLAAAILSPWAANAALAQDHSNHGTTAATMACCADHKMAAAPAPVAAPMPCCAEHKNAAAPAPAAAMACCDDKAKAAPAKPMACCDQTAAPTAKMAAGCCDGNDPLVAAAGLGLPGKPAVQTLAVNFQQPVRVGNTMLLGRYVFEHDDARMARGEPCTYIFAAADRREPVVTFHCTHLERAATDTATVVLTPADVNGIRHLSEFQYGGDTAAHGIPAVR